MTKSRSMPDESSPNNNLDLEELREMADEPGTDDVLEIYEDESGYGGKSTQEQRMPPQPQQRAIYTDSSA